MNHYTNHYGKDEGQEMSLYEETEDTDGKVLNEEFMENKYNNEFNWRRCSNTAYVLNHNKIPLQVRLPEKFGGRVQIEVKDRAKGNDYSKHQAHEIKERIMSSDFVSADRIWDNIPLFNVDAQEPEDLEHMLEELSGS